MKILTIHASAGAGHTKAAEAVYNRLKETTRHQVVFVDALDYTPAYYKKGYQKGYAFLVCHFSWLWGFFFWMTDLPWLRPLVRAIRRFFNSINAKRLEQFLINEQFDVIFSTHFLPNEVGAYLKKTGKIKSRFISVVTDYDVHSFWVADSLDAYALACPQTKKTLLALGVAEDKIVITGIPTDSQFSRPKDLDGLRERLGLRKDIFTVLLATGSFGIGPMEEIAGALDHHCQVLIVCGRNRKLFDKLNRRPWVHAKIHGLVNNMHELMAVSHVMVTKPGGLSISEALVSHLPLIFFQAIPGQEENNVRILKEEGVGVNSLGHVDIITEEIKKMMRSETYLAHMKEKVEKLARPSAVDDIIRMIK